jgi:hypothetical protein
MATSSDEYPVRCECSDEELTTLKEWFEDNDHTFGEKVRGEWPPSDERDNVYPIFFTPDDLSDTYEALYDNNRRYSPFSGNKEPVSRGEDSMDVCNAPLSRWRRRYPNVRFCGQTVSPGDTYCSVHKSNRKPLMKTAEEQLQSGLFAQSIDHVYANLGPWKRLFGWGSFESLMGESTYEFGVEYEPRQFDFSDADLVPDDADEDGVMEVRCGYPTQHTDPALSLYVAAMMGVQMITVQPRIMYENPEEGERMMESKTIETAQLTAPPTEHDPSEQEFKTLETWSEHHLNLPLSRIVTDRPKLLERGGVDTDAEDDDADVDASNVVLEIEAEGDDVETADTDGTDPNYAASDDELLSESEKIEQKTS